MERTIIADFHFDVKLSDYSVILYGFVIVNLKMKIPKYTKKSILLSTQATISEKK